MTGNNNGRATPEPRAQPDACPRYRVGLASSGRVFAEGLFCDSIWSRTCITLRLSGKDIDLIRTIFGGNGEKEAAAQLGLSRRAIHWRLERLHAKLSVRSRSELILRLVAVLLVECTESCGGPPSRPRM